MLFKVVEWNKNNIRDSDPAPSFFLERDSWNDYDFYTTYHLHIAGKHTKNREITLIGLVKILQLDQEKLEIYLLNLGLLPALPDDFCSLGQSLDYYQRIAQIDKPLRDQLLEGLRDVVIFPEIENEFEAELGFRDSLLRSVARDSDLFTMAPLMISRDFTSLLDKDLSFSFSIPEYGLPLEFSFKSPTYSWENRSLPERIIVIIGRNGSGKSTLLARIARIAFASVKDRNDEILKQIGVIKPEGLGFPRIIALSYSAFDSFQVPGIYGSEKELIIEETKNGLGRYVFCGIRDIVSELEGGLPKLAVLENGRLTDEEILRDRQENTLLKQVQVLSEEFIRNLKFIESSPQSALFDPVMEILSEEASLHSLAMTDFLWSSEADNKDFFMHLSTGHKFVFHAITSILAFVAPRSLLLFDEPETHLHPPILATMMKAIRYILGERNAFMIVATHSPVVLQETLKQHVYFMQREGNSVDFTPPDIQTFGENIGLITSTVFGLTSDLSNYHSTLDQMVETLRFFDSEPDKLFEQVEQAFGGELSMQARAYVLSKIYGPKQ